MLKISLSIALAVVLSSSPALAQNKNKPKPKPKPKPAATQQKPATKGTTQLPGDNGAFGVTYTMGTGNDAFNVTLTSAEYAFEPVVNNGAILSGSAEEKLLLVRMTVQNPNPAETRMDQSYLRVTAYLPDGQSFEQKAVLHANDRDSLNVLLKPSQKVEAIAVIELPAGGEVVKLMVQHWTEGSKVLRLNVKDKIKALPSPYSESPFAVKSEIPATIGTEYNMGAFNITIEGFETREGRFGDHEAEEDQRILIVKAVAKNPVKVPQSFYSAWMEVSLRDADGEKYQPTLFAAGSRDVEHEQRELKLGETNRIIENSKTQHTVRKPAYPFLRIFSVGCRQ